MSSPVRLPPARWVTQTAAFRRWFGDSKVVDENGEPLVVHHGTLADFSEFDVAGIEGGAFFTTDPAVAAEFARWNWESGGEGEQTVMPVYLSIRNPKVIRPSEVMPDGEHSFDAMIAAIKRAKREGHDGLHIPDTPDMDAVADQWVAFRPEQIKSVFNRGTFDPDDPNILADRTKKRDDVTADVGSDAVRQDRAALPRLKAGASRGVGADIDLWEQGGRADAADPEACESSKWRAAG